MFWIKKTLESEEFRKLFGMLEEQRIKLESLALEVQLYKKKLRSRAGIEKEEEKEEAKGINNPVILPEDGNISNFKKYRFS